MKIVTIVGARPQFIKAAPMSIALKKNKINEVIVHTGQHYDKNMSDVFFDELNISKPKYNLKINGGSHGEMTGNMIKSIEKILQIERPSHVLLYGDTNSTLAGAIAASKFNDLQICHIEAGLRSNNLKMPEEINRIITDRLSDILFCPSIEAVNNLKNEGAPYKTQNGLQEIFITGDIMYDSVKLFSNLHENNNSRDEFLLFTLHRQENTDDKTVLKNIFESINHIAKSTKIKYLVHPRISIEVKKFKFNENVELLDPVGYMEMLQLVKSCKAVITDSGGLQKEAFYLNKYCATLRTETEWTELIDLDVNRLYHPSIGNMSELISDLGKVECQSHVDSPYGEGQTAEIIVKKLLQ